MLASSYTLSPTTELGLTEAAERVRAERREQTEAAPRAASVVSLESSRR
jgi:hypothetical protein